MSYLWNIDERNTHILLDGVDGQISQLDVSPDGHTALVLITPSRAQDDEFQPADNLPPGAPPPPSRGQNNGEPPTAISTLLWLDIEIGDILHRLELDAAPTEVAFVPDGKSVAFATTVPASSIARTDDSETEDEGDNANTVGSDPIAVVLYDPETGRREPRFIGHDSEIRSIRFSSDGQRMVTGSVGRNVIVWDFASGTILHTIPEISIVQDAMFTPDGSAIVTVVEDGTPALWRSEPFTLEEALAWARANRAVRAADVSECRRYRMENFCEEQDD